jgi:glycosyltransferase involved in cell wall biosynthesis
MSEPLVSIILPGWNSHRTVGACLDSLRAQTFRDFEVILVDSSPGPETERIVRERYPEVVFRRHEGRLLPHAARNLGAKIARGRIFVFSDPDCLMHPFWLERLVVEHRRGRDPVGGSVEDFASGWFAGGVHWCKYAWWLPGGDPGTRPELPSANASYSRALFERIGGFPDFIFGDTLLSRNAAFAGAEPWFVPDAIVRHDHPATWRTFLAERYSRGRDFGLARPRLEGWSRGRSLLMAAAAPAILAVMLARALRYSLAARRGLRFAIHFPVAVIGSAARQIGESVGYTRAARTR